MDSVRFQRIFAESLARIGFAVLRFDYLGTGDSAYEQTDDDSVKNWRHSVEYAVDYLRSIGAPTLTAIGMRAGALILSEVARNCHNINRVVYFDPVCAGRRYLREQATLFHLVVGSDADPDGTLSMVGARLNAKDAQEFSSLTLDIPSRGVVDHLLVLRKGESERRLDDLSRVDGVRTVMAEGLAEFTQSADVVVPMPLAALDQVVAWVDSAESRERVRVSPRCASSAVMPVETETGVTAVIECVETIGPRGLFAIRTKPVKPAPGRRKTVLFYATGNDTHLGPGREWVELSRRVAAHGAEAVRWDRAGLGHSAPISRKQWLPMFTKRDVVDAISAARHAASEPGDLQVVGICAGSWYAAHAARALRLPSATLISTNTWSWHPRLTWPQQWGLWRSLHTAGSVSNQGRGLVKKSLPRLTAAARSALGSLKRGAHVCVPRSAAKLWGRMGFMQVPELMLTTLADQGTATTLLLSPVDADLFAETGGHSALRRLSGAAVPPRLILIPDGDHAAFRQSMLEAVRQEVLSQLGATESHTRDFRNDHGSAVRRPTCVR